MANSDDDLDRVMAEEERMERAFLAQAQPEDRAEAETVAPVEAELAALADVVTTLPPDHPLRRYVAGQLHVLAAGVRSLR